MFCEELYNAKEEGGKKLLCNIIRGLYLLIFSHTMIITANIKNAKNKCGDNNFDMQKVMLPYNRTQFDYILWINSSFKCFSRLEISIFKYNRIFISKCFR